MTQMRAELDMIAFDVGTDPVRQGILEIRWRLMSWVESRQAWNKDDFVRVVIDADVDIDRTFDEVEAMIAGLGYERPPADDREYLRDSAKRAWNPAVRAAVAKDRAEKAEQAQREAAESAREVERQKTEREASVARAAKELLREAGVDLDAIAAERQAKAAGGSKA